MQRLRHCYWQHLALAVAQQHALGHALCQRQLQRIVLVELVGQRQRLLVDHTHSFPHRSTHRAAGIEDAQLLIQSHALSHGIALAVAHRLAISDPIQHRLAQSDAILHGDAHPHAEHHFHGGDVGGKRRQRCSGWDW